MASVNTNAAALTALRTLQATNQQLETTQARISTGYKIGEAKDNAAYWAISTTLKSDNKALSTVKDALNLGAATVDVAYQSMVKVKDVLDEIKSKLVAATQDGVDKTKIQAEIASLQNQLTSISSSSNFSGENWLNVNSSDNGYSATKNVVASYTRDASGAVAIGTVAIDTSSMVLIDRKANAEGILDAGVAGNTNAGGLAALGNTGLGATSGSYVTADVSAATGFATLANADTVQLSYTVDGVARTTSSLTLSGISSSSAANSGAAIVAALQGDTTFNSLATVSYAGGKFTITSRTSGASSAATVTALNWVQGGTANNSTGATGATAVTTAGANAKVTMGSAFVNATNGLALDSNDSLSFDLTVDGTATRVTINQNTINTVLGSGAAGKVTSSADFQAVLKEGLRVAGLSNVTVSTASNAIVFQGGVGTTTTAITVTNVNASQGTNLLTFDMSTATAQQLSTYITAVNAATTKVTAAAALLGSVASRIDMQKTFVNTLMDTIDKGVSNLVDADMSEESTKLQALQVKQQLGTQALSIANQSAQSVLSLFRS